MKIFIFPKMSLLFIEKIFANYTRKLGRNMSMYFFNANFKDRIKERENFLQPEPIKFFSACFVFFPKPKGEQKSRFITLLVFPPKITLVETNGLKLYWHLDLAWSCVEPGHKGDQI